MLAVTRFVAGWVFKDHLPVINRASGAPGFSLCPGGKHESANHMRGKKSS
jgi:hypothetical protein